MTDRDVAPSGFELAGENPWRTERSGVVFENPRLRVRLDQVIQPDGSPGEYTYVEVPGAVVAIVPLGEDGLVHLVRQWRYPWQRNSWEIPAGHAEGDEEPLAAAQRELEEEVGLRATNWRPLGVGYGSAALTVRAHLFLASGLHPVGGSTSRDPSEEDLIARAFPLAEAVEAAMNDTIVHAYTVIGLLRAARLLGV